MNLPKLIIFVSSAVFLLSCCTTLCTIDKQDFQSIKEQNGLKLERCIQTAKYPLNLNSDRYIEDYISFCKEIDALKYEEISAPNNTLNDSSSNGINAFLDSRK